VGDRAYVPYSVSWGLTQYEIDRSSDRQDLNEPVKDDDDEGVKFDEPESEADPEVSSDDRLVLVRSDGRDSGECIGVWPALVIFEVSLVALDAPVALGAPVHTPVSFGTRLPMLPLTHKRVAFSFKWDPMLAKLVTTDLAFSEILDISRSMPFRLLVSGRLSFLI